MYLQDGKYREQKQVIGMQMLSHLVLQQDLHISQKDQMKDMLQ